MTLSIDDLALVEADAAALYGEMRRDDQAMPLHRPDEWPESWTDLPAHTQALVRNLARSPYPRRRT